MQNKINTIKLWLSNWFQLNLYTVGCSRKCSFCGFHNPTPKPLDNVRITKLLIQAKRKRSRSIFVGGGEPFNGPSNDVQTIIDSTNLPVIITTSVFSNDFNYNNKNILYTIHLDDSMLEFEFNNILKIKSQNPNIFIIAVMDDDLTLNNINQIFNFIKKNELFIFCNNIEKGSNLIFEHNKIKIDRIAEQFNFGLLNVTPYFRCANRIH